MKCGTYILKEWINYNYLYFVCKYSYKLLKGRDIKFKNHYHTDYSATVYVVLYQKKPNNAVLTTFDNPEIFVTFVLLQVGQVGLDL